MVRELSNEKRKKFLHTALKLFASKGVQNTSTAAIAKEAGTATGTLFLYFPSKQHLVNELVMEISKQQADSINRLLNPSLSVRDTLLSIWEGSIHWLLENPDAYQFNQQIREPGLIPVEVAMESAKFLRYYFDAIQKGFTEGAIKPLPIDMIGGYLYQDIVAVMNFLRTQTDSGNQGEIIHKGFELFWNGIRKDV